jgi:hypothetical protein
VSEREVDRDLPASGKPDDSGALDTKVVENAESIFRWRPRVRGFARTAKEPLVVNDRTKLLGDKACDWFPETGIAKAAVDEEDNRPAPPFPSPKRYGFPPRCRGSLCLRKRSMARHRGQHRSMHGERYSPARSNVRVRATIPKPLQAAELILPFVHAAARTRGGTARSPRRCRCGHVYTQRAGRTALPVGPDASAA